MRFYLLIMEKKIYFSEERNWNWMQCNVINKVWNFKFSFRIWKLLRLHSAFLKSVESKALNCNLMSKSIFHRDLLMIFVCAHFSSQKSTRTISSVFIVILCFLIFRCSKKWVSDVIENFLFHELGSISVEKKKFICFPQRKHKERKRERFSDWWKKAFSSISSFGYSSIAPIPIIISFSVNESHLKSTTIPHKSKETGYRRNWLWSWLIRRI